MKSGKIKVRSTLGKKKNLDLTVAKDATLSFTLAPSILGISSSFWLNDEEGREVGFQIKGDDLKSLHAIVGEVLKEQERFDSWNLEFEERLNKELDRDS
jgi:hypothetical protein